MSVEVFISYCHADEKYRKELETHLALLKRQGLVSTWHDRMIQPGEKWATRIDHAVNRCAVVLLLVSADFVHSDYCWGVELKRALERHEAGNTIVIPIAVRRCDWAGAPFAEFQALPKDAKPVADWSKRDHAWTDVAKGLRTLVTRAAKPAEPAEPEPPPARPPGRKTPPPPPPPPRAKPASEPARTPGTVFETFLTALADESGRQLAQEGMKGLWQALRSAGTRSEPTTRAALAAELLTCADHGRLGDILRDSEFPVPAKKADRARSVANNFEWNTDLIAAAFTAPLLRDLCDALDLPRGLKAEMAQDLVDAVDEVSE